MATNRIELTSEMSEEDYIFFFLDKIRIQAQNAQEEYESYLKEFEEKFGEQARERYEEAYL
jgi:hypothetical protein